MSGTTAQFLILGFLLITNALFAMAEIAVVSSRKALLKTMAEDGSLRAKAALELANGPTRFLSMVQLGMTLCTILLGAFSGATVAETLAHVFERFSIFGHYGHIFAYGVVVAASTAFTLIFGELVPKRIALSNPERFAMLLAGTMQKLAWISSPLVWILSATTDAILGLFGVRHHKETPITEDEVNILIEQGLHAGVFHKAEKDMVEGVLRLDHRPVTSIMTPRPKIVWIRMDDSEEVNWRKIVSSGHSHFPVYQETRDQVLGTVAVKALWAHSAIGLHTNLKNLLVPPLIVPETMNAIQLLESFKKSGKHIALVADEFGGIQGLVTLIDVLEAIVGDLPERGEREQPGANRRDDGSWLVDATMPLEEVKPLIGIDAFPHVDQVDIQTLGGLMMTHFGRIPAAGDSFAWEGWRFEIMDMDRHRVDKVLLTKIPAPADVQKAAS